MQLGSAHVPVLICMQEDGLQAYIQICSSAQETATPVRLQCSSGQIVKHLAKPQANKWYPTKKRNSITKSKRASFKPLMSLDAPLWNLHKLNSFWTLSEDGIYILISWQALARAFATCAYQLHLTPLTRSEVTWYLWQVLGIHLEGSGENRIVVD